MNPFFNQSMVPNNNNVNLISLNINNNIQNTLNSNPTLKELVNKIINFYHFHNNKNMNFNNQKQINSLLNNLNPNYPGFLQNDKIDDPLPYVKEKK